ncbi:MAG: ABC transporter ATP-binding protein [Bdellovibrionota bacterium]
MKKSTASIILKVILKQKKISALIFFFSALSTILNSIGLTLLVPVLFKVFNIGSDALGVSKIDSLIAKYLWWLPSNPLCLLAFAVSLFIFKNALITLRVFLVAKISQRHLLQFRTELIKHYLKKDLHFFYKEGSGNISNQLLMNVEKSAKVIVDTIESLGMCVQLLAYACVLTYISWQLFLVCFVGFFPLIFTLKFIRNRVKVLSLQRAVKFGVLSQSINDTIRGIRLVKLANEEKKHADWVEHLSKDLQEKLTKISFLTGVAQPITEVAAIIILVSFISAVVYLGPSANVKIDTFFTFLLILSRSLPLFNIVLNRVIEIAGAYGTLKSVELALADKRWTTAIVMHKTLGRIKKDISFRKVSFQYPESDRKVLNEITLNIKQGDSVAIIGPSGSGKSTLSDLLLRFYTPTNGIIAIDGEDISQMDIKEYRKRIGLVSQDSILFFSTIRENLCYFKKNAHEIDIWRALDQADLADFVSSLPMGLETSIGEGGVQLSGGQRQRLSIARTLLLNPEVMIFDEATSSLDTVSEAKIVESIKSVSKGRTSITIAHRLATILHCDKVFLIEHGWLIEEGSISDLLQKNSRFKKYAESQNLKLVA